MDRGELGVDDPVSRHLPAMAKSRLRVCGDAGAVPCTVQTAFVSSGISMVAQASKSQYALSTLAPQRSAAWQRSP